jgi:hypothetical protein
MVAPAFVDAYRTARQWADVEKPWEGRAAIDDAGWPTSDAGIVLFGDARGHGGTYDLSFTGRADVVVFPGSQVQTQAVTYDQTSNRTTGKLVIDDEAHIVTVSFRNTSGGIRDLRILRPLPAYKDTPFTAEYVESLRPFGSIRFMDAQKINDSKIVTWADSPKATDLRWNRGYPPELIVELANAAGVNPWVSMPHMADDDYVRQFAQLVRERLDPSLRVYVEYSNEIWNGQFGQARWCEQQGLALGLHTDPNVAKLRFQAQRSAEMMRIWQTAFADQPQRLVRVLASQSANPWIGGTLLDSPGGGSDHDALAIAPYFGHALGAPRTADQIAAMPLSAVIARLREEITTQTAKDIAGNARNAAKHKVKLLGYEGGQHLAGTGGAENVDALTKALHVVNRSPQMGELYALYLRTWFANGGDEMFLFEHTGRLSKWGSWGMIERWSHDGPTEAPKLAGIRPWLHGVDTRANE